MQVYSFSPCKVLIRNNLRRNEARIQGNSALEAIKNRAFLGVFGRVSALVAPCGRKRKRRTFVSLCLATGAVFGGLADAQSGGSDSAYSGSASCQACHPEQGASQALSGHANSLARPWQHRLAETFASGSVKRVSDRGRVRLRIDGKSAAIETSAGTAADSEPADWAFGAGEQAVTFVSRVDRDWYLEHRWSYYAATGALELTPGHQATDPDESGSSTGIRYRIFSPRAEILNCFGCHSTGPLRLGNGYSIVPSEPGVRCEACHGGGATHIRAVAKGNLERALALIRHPGRLPPGDLNAYCGACHRPPQSNPEEIDWGDPWNVRHQPVYLSRSLCFQSERGLSCLSCHDPHTPLVRAGTEHYNARCMECHAGPVSAPAAVCPPSEAAACSSCHMPRVRPQAELEFTNHWIGVYQAGNRLQPRR